MLRERALSNGGLRTTFKQNCRTTSYLHPIQTQIPVAFGDRALSYPTTHESTLLTDLGLTHRLGRERVALSLDLITSTCRRATYASSNPHFLRVVVVV